VGLAAGDGAAVRQLDLAVSKLLTFSNDPIAEVDTARAMDPGLVMDHVLKGLLCSPGTEESALPDAQAALTDGLAVSKGAADRERPGTRSADGRRAQHRLRDLVSGPLRHTHGRTRHAGGPLGRFVLGAIERTA
jgi:hypothetical protein